MRIDSVDVGVGMADHAHAYVLGDLTALEVGDHGMPETMEALPRHLVLAALGIAGVYPSLSHDADKGLAEAAAASGKGLAHRGQDRRLKIAGSRPAIAKKPGPQIRMQGQLHKAVLGLSELSLSIGDKGIGGFQVDILPGQVTNVSHPGAGVEGQKAEGLPFVARAGFQDRLYLVQGKRLLDL